MDYFNDICLFMQSQSWNNNRRKLMFYSPNKEFVRFSTYRTAEIKALRERIQAEKVTQEQIDSTQLRLERLRKEYEELQQQQHVELKEVYQNSERAIADLLKEKNLSEKEYSFIKQQFDDLERRRIQLQQKGAALEEQVRLGQSEKDKLVAKKVALEDQLLSYERDYQNACKEVNRMIELKKELDATESELKEKKEQFAVAWEESRNDKAQLINKIRQEQERIQVLKRQWENSEKEAQHQRLMIQQSKLTQELFQGQIAAFSSAKTSAEDDDCMLVAQKQLGQYLDAMLRSVAAESARISKEEQDYQKNIKSLLSNVSQDEQSKAKLQQKIDILKSNLHLLREKNESLRVKMNSIFKNDSQLVRLITSKKTYPHVKGEIVEIVKKSAIQPFESKENIVLPPQKEEKIDIGGSSRAFTEVNRMI